MRNRTPTLLLVLACLLPACGGGGDAGIQVPSLTSVQPDQAPASGGDVVTLSGSGFAGGVTNVDVGGQAATDVSVVDDTTLTCTVPAGGPGVQDVAVRTAGGTASLPDALTRIARLDGSYARITFDGWTGAERLGLFPADQAMTTWGTATVDGATGAIHALWDGKLSGPPDGSGTGASQELYNLLDGARVEVARLRGPSNLGVQYVGGVGDGLAGPDVVALGRSVDDPGIAVYLNRAGGAAPGAPSTPATLAGQYTMVAFLHYFALDAESTLWGSLRLDGAAAVTDVTLTSNYNGTITGPAAVADGSYGVDADRGLTLTLGNLKLEGAFLGAGELAVLAGSSDPSIDVEAIVFLVPVATTAVASTFSGRYHHVLLAGLRADAWSPTDPHFVSITGTATSNGGGLLDFGTGAIVNQDGLITVTSSPPGLPPGATAVGYAVAPSGALQLGDLRGAVSPDGRFAAVAGPITTSQAPGLYLFVRAP